MLHCCILTSPVNVRGVAFLLLKVLLIFVGGDNFLWLIIPIPVKTSFIILIKENLSKKIYIANKPHAF